MKKKLNKRIFYASLFVFIYPCVNPGYSQTLIKTYVEQNSVPIKTVDPDSTEFSDLEPFGDAIGNSRVVMLGEGDHGDAPTFLAKTRLIKYLHEKKGFNVLAFESDFFGLNEGWAKLPKNNAAIDSFIRTNIFPVWTVCSTCSTLFYNYIPNSYATKTPLNLTGFDSQQYLRYAYYHLTQTLDSVFHHLNLPITREPNYVTEILPIMDSAKKWIFVLPKDTVNVHNCLGYLNEMKMQLNAVVTPDNFWVLVLNNLLQQTKAVVIKYASKKDATNERDIQMAINLKWLIENKYKDQKIIVWAADYHISRSVKNVAEGFFKTTETMGEHLVASLAKPNEVYIMGFTSSRGTAGRIGMKTYSLRPVRKNSFETWFTKDSKYAFVDFLKFNQRNPIANENFYMAPMGHFDYLAQWNHIYDGIFYIRDMYNCVRIKP